MDRFVDGADGDVAGSAVFHNTETDGEPSNDGAASTSTAPEPGQSSPENSRSPSGTPPGCTCGGYRVELPSEDEDPRTGEITKPSFQRRSTAVFCPHHGVNEAYRNSFTEHAAWIARRGDYRRCDLWHATVKLHRADVKRLGLDTADTKPVLSQLLPRLRKRLKRRDEAAEVLLSMSPRPGDGQWHLHVLVLSKECSDRDLIQVFQLAGTETEITTPRSREESRDEGPMSAETFAACIGAYLFKNRVQGAVQGAETKFSSWGDGVGYFSEAARKRRREYAKAVAEAGGDTAPASDDPTRAGCTTTQFPTDEGSDNGETEATEADDRAVQPVRVGVNVVQSEAEYRRVVIRALLERQYTDVRVQGVGRCRLTWVEAGDGASILCYVRPLGKNDDGQRVVPWRFVEATETPVIRRSTDQSTGADMDTEADTEPTDTAEGAAEEDTDTAAVDRFLSEARYSNVAFRLADGSRYVEATDHETGEVTETTKPPRQSR